MINTGWNLYWVLGGSSVAPQPTVDSIAAFDPYRMYDGRTIEHPQGAMFCIWCDKGDTDGTDEGDNVIATTEPLIAKFGEVLANKLKKSYSSALTTESRPTLPVTGQFLFDTTLGKPVWWAGAKWVDATGAEV